MGQALEMLAVVLVGLGCELVKSIRLCFRIRITYEGQTTICAEADLRLIHVDEDPGVSQWTSSSVARYNALLSPVYWLLVDQLNGCQRSWLSFD